MKILKNIEKSGFSKKIIFLQIVLGVGWGIREVHARAGTTPGSLLRRLRRPQGIASGAEVCAMGAARVDSAVPNPKNQGNMKNMKRHEKSC